MDKFLIEESTSYNHFSFQHTTLPIQLLAVCIEDILQKNWTGKYNRFGNFCEIITESKTNFLIPNKNYFINNKIENGINIDKIQKDFNKIFDFDKNPKYFPFYIALNNFYKGEKRELLINFYSQNYRRLHTIKNNTNGNICFSRLVNENRKKSIIFFEKFLFENKLEEFEFKEERGWNHIISGTNFTIGDLVLEISNKKFKTQLGALKEYLLLILKKIHPSIPTKIIQYKNLNKNEIISSNLFVQKSAIDREVLKLKPDEELKVIAEELFQ